MVEDKYAVVILKDYINNYLAFSWLQMEIPRFFHRVQEGLNVKLEEIGNCAFPIVEYNRWMTKTPDIPLCYR